LTGSAIVAGHDIHGKIDHIDNLAVALANACGFHDDEIEAERFQIEDMVREHFAGREVLTPRGERPHEYVLRTQRVHADAVAQQRSTSAPSGRVHGEHGNAHLGITSEKAVQKLVSDAAFACAARTCDADHRHVARLHVPFFAELSKRGLVKQALFNRGNHLRDIDGVVRGYIIRDHRRTTIFLGTRNEIVDHLVETHLHAVVRVIDSLDSVSHELRNFFRGDRAAASAENLDVRRIPFAQPVDHVAKEFEMTALIRTDGNTVRIFLNRRAHDIVHATIVA